jgi:hypothetical protein
MSKSKIEILDEVFSKYIRLRGADYRGYNTCFTCGVSLPWKQLQCGHYISRQHLSLRFDPKNCFPQCFSCNCEKNGNIAEYKKKIIRNYGIVHLHYLTEKKNEIKQYSDFELDILISYYKKKIKEMNFF